MSQSKSRQKLCERKGWIMLIGSVRAHHRHGRDAFFEVTGFLPVISIEDGVRYGRSSFPAVAAMLDEHGHDNFRVAVRSVTDEPCVVFRLLRRFVVRLLANDLRRSGLPRDIETFDASPRAGAAFIDDA